eukprot:6214208-Pleurochrysis_carterae.AAC.10
MCRGLASVRVRPSPRFAHFCCSTRGRACGHLHVRSYAVERAHRQDCSPSSSSFLYMHERVLVYRIPTFQRDAHGQALPATAGSISHNPRLAVVPAI